MKRDASKYEDVKKRNILQCEDARPSHCETVGHSMNSYILCFRQLKDLQNHLVGLIAFVTYFFGGLSWGKAMTTCTKA